MLRHTFEFVNAFLKYLPHKHNMKFLNNIFFYKHPLCTHEERLKTKNNN